MTPQPPEDQIRADQDAAVQMFRAWHQEGRAYLDTETTGLEGKVWEFALVGPDLSPLLAFTCDPMVSPDDWSARAREMMEARHPQLGGLGRFPDSSSYGHAVARMLDHHPAVAYQDTGKWFDNAAIRRTWFETDATYRGSPNSWAAFGCAQEVYAVLAGKWSESRGAWKYVSLSEACELEHVDLRGLPAAHGAYGDACRLALLVAAVAARETHAEREYREDVEAAEARGEFPL